MNVIFLHGPAAAGKYTIGSLLSTLVDMPLFHNHLVVDAVKALFEFGTEPFIELREEMWLAAFRVAANAGQSFIFTFNPEVTVDVQLVPRLQQCVAHAGGQIMFVELSCADEVLVGRMNQPSRAQFGKLLDPELYLALKAHGQFDFPPLPDPIVVVDTAAQLPIESAQLIADAYTRVLSE
jgi:chloramphenicol 3-O-phosphotransferase